MQDEKGFSARKKQHSFFFGTVNHCGVQQIFKLKSLPLLILLAFNYNSFAAEEFSAEMLKAVGNGGNMDGVDLNYFANEGGQAPGTYSVDVFLNNELIERRSVIFVDVPDSPGKIFGKVTPAQLYEYGVKDDVFPALKTQSPGQTLEKPLVTYIPDATEKLDLAGGKYYITVPQIGVRPHIRNAVDPSLWDDGIPALMVNYNYSGSDTDDEISGDSQSNYLNLRSGINLGAWRLRNYSTYADNTNDDGDKTQSWDSIQTYLQRDVRFLQGGQLTLGEYSSPGEVFDSVQFTGAQLSSDDNMLPDRLRQYAPIIRGIARSNAQVTIEQDGYTIYQTNVAPGPFSITDLYPSSNGGDMKVTIKEADGSTTQYTQATRSVPILQREGRLKYSATAGRYRSGVEDVEEPYFGQLTAIYGLSSNITAYGGTQFADNYKAASAGLGMDMGRIGALSLDVTHAVSTLEGIGDKTGQSYRLMYAKNIDQTDTNLQLAGYRYSTKGYYSFDDVQKFSAETEDGLDEFNRTHNARSKIQASINQNIADLATIYFSASEQDYWGGDGKELSLQTGLTSSFKGMTYGLNYSYTKNPGIDESDQVLAFNMSIPFSAFMNSSQAWASYNMTSRKDGSTTQQAGVNGTLLENNNLSYSVQQGYENKGGGASGSSSLDYKGSSGEALVGYSYTDQNKQMTYGLSGGVLVHENGVTLSQYMGDSVTLVKAPGASDVYIENSTGVSTDWRGYAVVPYAQPYKKNEVRLRTESMGSKLDIAEPSLTVIPTKGAVVLAKYNAKVGDRALITMTYAGAPLPFGTVVSVMDSETDNTGIVGENGEVYLTGLAAQGRLLAKWGNGTEKQCYASYQLASTPETAEDLIKQASAQCK
ncbi:UNVERIFIED_ORG: outer membrane usher protein [Rahnella aquatilis]